VSTEELMTIRDLAGLAVLLVVVIGIFFGK
jgi:hypothetical protein